MRCDDASRCWTGLRTEIAQVVVKQMAARHPDLLAHQTETLVDVDTRLSGRCQLRRGTKEPATAATHGA